MIFGKAVKIEAILGKTFAIEDQFCLKAFHCGQKPCHMNSETELKNSNL